MDALVVLPPEVAYAIMQTAAILFSGLYSGIEAVVAIRDCDNQRSTDYLPLVLPYPLAVICPAKVTKLIHPQRG